MTNHSNDPTGEQGENRPAWFEEMTQFFQWQENQTSRNQTQQNHRDEMRAVQEELGVIQPPLGIGNQALRSEIAAQNPAQQVGPQELAANIEVVAINVAAAAPAPSATQNDSDSRPASQNSNPRRRERSPTPGIGSSRPSNRRRTDGRTIQDTIDEGRENLNGIAAAIGDMARAVSQDSAPAPAPAPRPFIDDPIGSLRAIHDNMMLVAADLGPTEAYDSRVRMYHTWQAMLGQFATANSLQIPAAPPMPAHNSIYNMSVGGSNDEGDDLDDTHDNDDTFP